MLDVNGDGRLGYAELIGTGRLVNSDGKLPRQFLLSLGAAPVRTYGGMLVPAFPKRAPSGSQIAPSASAWFTALDRNRDGIVSPREFVGPLVLFAQLDANGDGMISVAEAEAN